MIQRSSDCSYYSLDEVHIDLASSDDFLQDGGQELFRVSVLESTLLSLQSITFLVSSLVRVAMLPRGKTYLGDSRSDSSNNDDIVGRVEKQLCSAQGGDGVGDRLQSGRHCEFGIVSYGVLCAAAGMKRR